jgi:hypothetical protein
MLSVLREGLKRRRLYQLNILEQVIGERERVMQGSRLLVAARNVTNSD